MFVRTPKYQGGFVCYVSDEVCSYQKLTEKFGQAEEGCEPEKGYNWAFGFTGEQGNFSIYDRWGCARIGGAGDLQAFGVWLAEQMECTVEELKFLNPGTDHMISMMRVHAEIDAMMQED